MMFFHDDDVLHPRYLEFAEKIIAENKYVSLISSRYHSPKVVDDKNWEDVSADYYFCEGKLGFAKFLYGVGGISYPCTIYKNENLLDALSDVDDYGKIMDKMFMLNSVPSNGIAAVFVDKNLLRYRIHAGQDTSSVANGPFANQIIAHNKNLKNALSKSFSGRFVFASCCYKNLKALHRMGGHSKSELDNFVRRATAEGGACFTAKISSYILGKPIYSLCNIVRAIIAKTFPTRHCK